MERPVEYCSCVPARASAGELAGAPAPSSAWVCAAARVIVAWARCPLGSSSSAELPRPSGRVHPHLRPSGRRGVQGGVRERG
eukprot:11435183-Alexandrium_andersonii.AAC.1